MLKKIKKPVTRLSLTPVSIPQQLNNLAQASIIKLLDENKNVCRTLIFQITFIYTLDKNNFFYITFKNKNIAPLIILREKTYGKPRSSFSGISISSEPNNDINAINESPNNLKQILQSTEVALLELKTYRNDIFLELDDITDLLIFERKSLQVIYIFIHLKFQTSNTYSFIFLE